MNLIFLRAKTRKKVTAGIVAVSMVLWTPGVALGAGPIEPVGPQEPVGNIEPVGPQEPVGNQGPIGPSSDPGNIEAQPPAVTSPASEPTASTSTSSTSGEGVTGISGVNTGTGPDSTNTVQVGTTATSTTNVNNTSNNVTAVAGTANTGSNTSSSNTSTGVISTGNANIGVTQVKQDNTTALNGGIGLQVQGSEGTHVGDLALDFEKAVSLLTGDGGVKSVQAVNESTGPSSENEVILRTTMNDITEVQNDGQIDNNINVQALTGDNTASSNTGGGQIETGDANISATLVNLLNTTVVNGNLAVSVYDVFGDLLGSILLPDLAQLSNILNGENIRLETENDTTGPDSTNTINIDIAKNEQTNVTNTADVDTVVDASAITGQNSTLSNTGGGQIETGDAQVQAGNVTVANTTVEGGNWGLVIVNALNKWVGLLFGDNGQVTELSQEETLKEIEARNSNTGPDSTNTIAISDEHNKQTTINNDATINNSIAATAVTGGNTANYNTGATSINTGDANILANVVNIANTTVKDANLGIMVINIFGNWFGDLMYGGNSLLAGLGGESDPTIVAANSTTGPNSTNTIDIDIDSHKETHVDNDASVSTILNAHIDTGNNRSNSNTLGANVKTGNGILGLSSRTVANAVGIANTGGVTVDIVGTNDTTGVDSENRIRATINNERIVEIENRADVSTLLPATVNTGNNEVAFNTLGGAIQTGDAVARAVIDQLINKVVALLADGGTTIAASFLNSNTGFNSLNQNNLDVNDSSTLNIFNSAFIQNLIDLLLNTGGNTLAYNTGGGGITTGSVCVDGHIRTVVNDVDASGWSNVSIDNNAEIINQLLGKGTTGGNTITGNTTGGDAGTPEGCEKHQPQEPTPTPTPPPGGGNGGGDNGGGAGGGVTEEDKAEGKIAQAEAKEEKKPRIAGIVMKPMGGAIEALADTGASILLRQRSTSPWILFGIFSSLILAGAIHRDQRKRMMAPR
ncbi:MAG: hypothetical protein WD200_00505 [Candidatus Andersenbacteria bacterium]